VDADYLHKQITIAESRVASLAEREKLIGIYKNVIYKSGPLLSNIEHKVNL